jgi:PST family polysaccharide transporter
MFGVQVMLPNGMNWLFNAILIAGGILGISVIIPFVITSQATGAALSVLLIELFITISMGVVIYRRGYLFARRTPNNGL